MPNAKPNSIPHWQRQGAIPPSSIDSDANKSGSKNSEEQPLPRATLLEQAAKFLEHEDIRDASRAEKSAFLEGKGLRRDEIDHLLGILSNQDGPSNDMPTTTAARSETLSSSATDQKSSSIPPPGTMQSSATPPIITYPEFLLHSQRPLPLVTTSRILSALYLSSATAAAIYGTSQYLLKPMLESLTVARHSLFETASFNLENLNKKLESVVSHVPHSAGQVGTGTHDEDHYEDDDESETSDPTELFHRDTGTQTSPPLSPSSSSSSVNYLDPLASTPGLSAISRLKDLHTDLSSILSSNTAAADEDDRIKLRLNNLRDYLHDVRYGRTSKALRGETSKSNLDQEINSVKAEIRSVKGVLLSARSFPGASTGRSRVSAT